MLKELSLSLWRPPFSKTLISVCYLWENRNAKIKELQIEENENSFFFSISEQLIQLQMIDGVLIISIKHLGLFLNPVNTIILLVAHTTLFCTSP